MDDTQRRVDAIRKDRSELENHIIDEYSAGKITRREFVRRGTVVGMSIPLVSFLAAACGGGGGGETTGGGTTPTATGSVQAGGNIRVALIQPTTEPNPLLVQDEGGAGLLGSTGEFLSFSNAKLELEPRIAESWEPNEDGTVWTFKIRQGVTFHSGATLVANDVKTTFDKLINPDGGSANAQSALGGVLSPGGIEAPDDATVVFNLDAANGNFPTLVSSANYNAIIIPADLDPADWGKTFEGTGPFKLDSFSPKVGAKFVRNDAYWGTKANPDSMELKFYDEEGPMIARHPGRRGRLRRALLRLGRQGAPERPERDRDRGRRPRRTASSTCGRTRIRSRTSASARRSRSHSTARRSWTGSGKGQADVGNDSPFAPLYPSTDTSVPQREQNIDQAKQLLADAGMGDGFSVDLSTWNGFEIPDLAQLVKQYAAEIGVTVNLKITRCRHVLRRRRLREVDRGSTPSWASPTTATARCRTSILTAALSGNPKVGVWNSAHFKNDQYDSLVAAVRGGTGHRLAEGASRSRSRSSSSTRRRSSSRTSITS